MPALMPALMPDKPLYRHRQLGWTMLAAVMLPITILFAASGLVHPSGQAANALQSARPYYILLLGLPPVLALLFSSLEVILEPDELRIRFGPGLIRKRFRVTEFEHAVPARTTVLQGWGIHRRGAKTIYNVSGFSAVDIRLTNGEHVLIGSNDSVVLATAINRLIASHQKAAGRPDAAAF